MIHPTRTNLLLFREKSRSVANSIGLLKGRRQALIREFLVSSLYVLRSRNDISRTYAEAIGQLDKAARVEGNEIIRSIENVSAKQVQIDIVEQSVMGLRYRDIMPAGSPLRSPQERDYDYRLTTSHLEESVHLFETIIEDMLGLAAYESRIRRLAEEVGRVTRQVRVLEERILPDLRQDVRIIEQYLEERDREAYYRLKKFKHSRDTDRAAWQKML